MIAIAHMLEGYKNDTNPEVIMAASTKEQAQILFTYVANMIKANPRLATALRVMQYKITLRGKTGFIKTVASDGKSNHGYNPSLILCDEIHAWSETKGPELWEALETSRGFRGAKMISITTAGAAYTWAWGRHEYSRRVANGEITDPNHLAIIYDAPLDADPLSEETWKIANPSYEHLPGLKAHLDAEKIKAVHDPAKLLSFKKLYLNQWLGSQDGWIDFFDWQACKVERPADLDTWNCCIGCDLANTTDFNAVAVLWFKGGQFYTEQHYLICSSAMQKRENQYPALVGSWISQGRLTVVNRPSVTVQDKLDFINNIVKQVNPLKVFFDPWNAHEIALRLDEIYGKDYALAVPQVAKFTSLPMKNIHSMVLNNQFGHDGNPVTGWMIGNVVIFEDQNNNWKFDKRASPEKIDGPAAIITAMAGYYSEDLQNYGTLVMGFFS
jgi:phage terminase large subunit-like protein